MEFIYKLSLVDRLIEEDNWTKEDKAIVSKHFQHLVSLKNNGQLLLAGKTAGQDTDTMGLVIFKAKSFDDAQNIMQNDPAVKNEIMTAKLWEYKVALFNNEYKND